MQALGWVAGTNRSENNDTYTGLATIKCTLKLLTPMKNPKDEEVLQVLRELWKEGKIAFKKNETTQQNTFSIKI